MNIFLLVSYTQQNKSQVRFQESISPKTIGGKATYQSPFPDPAKVGAITSGSWTYDPTPPTIIMGQGSANWDY